MTQGWAHRSERGSLLALRLVIALSRRIGRTLARTLLFPIVAYFLATAPAERRASAQFLARALGRRPTRREVARHFHCFATTLLDRVYLVSGETWRFDLRVHGAEIVDDCLFEGRGCLALGSHLGSFDLMRVLGASEGGKRVKILMYPEHNPMITRLLHALNPSLSEMVIPLGRPDTLLRVRDCFERGEVVGMLGDRFSEQDRRTMCRFLGADAPFPIGPLLVAGILDVPVVIFFGLYRGGNRYDVHFERLAARIPAGLGPADVQALAQRYADRLEHYARLDPYNWFNFYDFWEPLLSPPSEGHESLRRGSGSASMRGS